MWKYLQDLVAWITAIKAYPVNDVGPGNNSLTLPPLENQSAISRSDPFFSWRRDGEIGSGSRAWFLAMVVVCSLMGTTQMGEALELGETLEPNLIIKGKLDRRRTKFKILRDGAEKDWHYGGYLDVGYLPNLTEPNADQWRSKVTDFKLNNPEVNMAMAYVRKSVNPKGSRWGGEFGVQTGVDSEGLVSNINATPISGADTLRHFYRANLSYLFPVGKGLKLTGGLMNSYMGYASFHSKNSINYTRGYISDNIPYFVFGLEAIYPATDTLTLGFYAISGFRYLSEPNQVPSFGLHTIWHPPGSLTLVQNFYYGPDQTNTDPRFWRFFSDSIIEWKSKTWKVAAAFDFGTEEQAGNPGHPRYIWTSGAIWANKHLGGPWWVGARPEFYWDPDGIITGAEQLIWAITGTIAYRVRVLSSHALSAKLEYRFDRSTGSGGGFFTGQQLAPGIPQLTPNQQLLIVGLTWAYDS